MQEYLEANFKDIAIAIKDIVLSFLKGKVLPLILSFIWSSRGAAPEVPKQEPAKEAAPEPVKEGAKEA